LDEGFGTLQAESAASEAKPNKRCCVRQTRHAVAAKRFEGRSEVIRESLTRRLDKNATKTPASSQWSNIASGTRVLALFAVVVVIFGAIVVVRYWAQLVANADQLLFAGGLFLTMMGGMFVQVITSNCRAEREILALTASQLLYPVLFGLVVFYTIWVLAADAPTICSVTMQPS
jgi:hypothetical protein